MNSDSLWIISTWQKSCYDLLTLRTLINEYVRLWRWSLRYIFLQKIIIVLETMFDQMKTIPCYYSIIFSDRRFTFSLLLPASRAKKPLHVLNHYFNNLEIICCEFSKRQLSQYYKELYKQIGLNSLKIKTPRLLEFISFDIDLKAEPIDAEYILKSLGNILFWTILTNMSFLWWKIL